MELKGTLTTASGLHGSISVTPTISGVLSASSSIELSGTLTPIGGIYGLLSASSPVVGQLSVPQYRGTQPFEGEYTYTPSSEAQTIEINGLRATDNITINPIPSNYGLITWDGATLTVS